MTGLDDPSPCWRGYWTPSPLAQGGEWNVEPSLTPSRRRYNPGRDQGIIIHVSTSVKRYRWWNHLRRIHYWKHRKGFLLVNSRFEFVVGVWPIAKVYMFDSLRPQSLD